MAVGGRWRVASGDRARGYGAGAARRDGTVIRVGWVLMKVALLLPGRSGSCLWRTRFGAGAAARYDDVHGPDLPAARPPWALAVCSGDRCQLLADPLELLDGQPEVSVGQDGGIAPLLGLGVACSARELDRDGAGVEYVDVGRDDGCGGRGARRAPRRPGRPGPGVRSFATAAPGSSSRGAPFGEPVPFQELEVVRRRARAQAGQLRALGGGQLFACRQGVDDGQPAGAPAGGICFFAASIRRSSI